MILTRTLSHAAAGAWNVSARLAKRLSARAAVLGAVLAACLLGGCQHLSVSGKPYIDEDTSAPPPLSIAVLPTTVGKQERQNLAAPMREAIYSALAPLPYNDRELVKIDEFVAKLAAEYGCRPDQVPREALADPRLADCVVYTNLEDVGRLFLVLYARVRLRLDFMMVDTRTRRVLYRNQFTIRDRIGSPFYNIFGLVSSSFYTLWHLRPEQLRRTMDTGAKRLVSKLPPPRIDLASAPTVRLAKVEVKLVRPVLREGDTVQVRAEASPHCFSMFSLGKIARDLPMQEISPGKYSGQYEIQHGDDADYVLPEFHFKAGVGSDEIDYTAVGYPIAIDTRPPPTARVARGRYESGTPGLQLELEHYGADAADKRNQPARYYLYRRPLGQGQFRRVGDTSTLTYHDREVDPQQPQQYEYFIITVDAAGNCSPQGNIVRMPGNKRS